MDLHGMEFSFWKRPDRDSVAIVEPDGTEHSVGQLQDAAHAVARGLRELGLKPGDAVAMCLRNSAAVYQVMLATSQAGFYLVPLNWHGSADDIAYIVGDSEVRAVIAHPELTHLVDVDLPRFAVLAKGQAAPEGWRDFAELTGGDPTPLDDRLAGMIMNYTSGTTGRPRAYGAPCRPSRPSPSSPASPCSCSCSACGLGPACTWSWRPCTTRPCSTSPAPPCIFGRSWW